MAIFKGITRRKGREEWWSIKVDSTLENIFGGFLDDPRPDAIVRTCWVLSDLNLVKERLCPMEGDDPDDVRRYHFVSTKALRRLVRNSDAL
jgi:hypothetical protein